VSKKGTSPILDFYVQQSQITDPGEYAYLFEDLPHSIQSLVKIVQGLVVSLPWEEAYSLDTPRERHRNLSENHSRNAEAHTRIGALITRCETPA
jgi:hypothetical protein